MVSSGGFFTTEFTENTENLFVVSVKAVLSWYEFVVDPLRNKTRGGLFFGFVVFVLLGKHLPGRQGRFVERFQIRLLKVDLLQLIGSGHWIHLFSFHEFCLPGEAG
jgi:hypothetical protein